MKRSNMAGAGKDEYVIKDTKVFATCRRALVLMGFIDDGSLISKIRKATFVFLLYTAPFHHLIPAFVDDTISLDGILISVSLLMLYILLCVSWPFMITRSDDILHLWETVRKGFYHYSDPLTKEERTILSETDDLVIKTTRISIIAYFCAGFGTYLKEMSPASMREYRPPYPGWMPFVINSNFRFILTLFYQLCICLNTTFALEAIFLLFAYHVFHFECQLRLLTQHFKDTFPEGLSATVTYGAKYRKNTLRRLKECVRHHLVIKRFHEQILSYFGICLLVYRVIVTIMLCILCYLVTTGISVNKFMQLLCLAMALLFLCFIFCIKGEQVAQMGDGWRKTVYEVEWWNHPVEVQKTIFMMQLGASKALRVYGVWKPVMYSHEGISVIGQEAFSFFNMLRAMK
uniref:Odorant receptor n=1 Tax=Adelphocoris lineolatus TaxID=236346 RepID=A0A2I4PH20_ADELI|nr:olfactory receptor 11 [Adelphocoris lineolatus]